MAAAAATVDTGVVVATAAAVAAIGVSLSDNLLVDLRLTSCRGRQRHAHGPLSMVNHHGYVTDLFDYGPLVRHGSSSSLS